MECFDAIYGRRSIRSYTSEKVSDSDVESLLRAAMAAPSAGNQQPWHFVVIDDRSILDTIPDFHPYSSMLKDAPVAITVCGDRREEKHEGFWVQDCSAAVENLLIAAHALGLGAVWLGVYPDNDRVRGTTRLLELPDNVVPLAIIAVGHPAEDKPSMDRYDPERVHRNGW